jgi:hypothetical protein
MLDEAIAPVRVLRRIDHDEGVREDGLDPRIAPCGEQVIGQSERGVAARDLVAMHAVGKPRHRHQAVLSFRLPAPCKTRHARLDLFTPGDVLGASDHGIIQRPAFPAPGIFDQFHPFGRSFRKRFEISDYLFRGGDVASRRMTGDLFERRNARIEGAFQHGLSPRRSDRPDSDHEKKHSDQTDRHRQAPHR